MFPVIKGQVHIKNPQSNIFSENNESLLRFLMTDQTPPLCLRLSNQEEAEWGRSFQSGVDSTSSLCTEEDDDDEEEVTR